MLKGIHPFSAPTCFMPSARMGHGDEIVIADANFPFQHHGPEVIRADGVSATDMAEAILAHMPLDTFVPESAWRMEVVGDPTRCRRSASSSRHRSKRAGDFKIVDARAFAFYERSRKAAYIVATTEFRLYGNLILKKGVVHPQRSSG
jgi:L-fucose mutarotase